MSSINKVPEFITIFTCDVCGFKKEVTYVTLHWPIPEGWEEEVLCYDDFGPLKKHTCSNCLNKETE